MNTRSTYAPPDGYGPSYGDDVIHAERIGDRRVSIVSAGPADNVDPVLAGRVETWGVAGERPRAVGILFDPSRYLVMAGEPLQCGEVEALNAAGFAGVADFSRC